MLRFQIFQKQFGFIDHENGQEQLTSIFAPYLSGYPDVVITVDGESLQVDSQVKTKSEVQLDTILEDDLGKRHPFSLSIYEWKGLRLHEMYLCDENGFPLYQYEKQIRGVGDYGFSAYLKSSYASWLNSEGRLGLTEMENELADAVAEALKRLKSYFYDRYIEDKRSLIDKWKDEQVYPYPKERRLNIVEDAGRKVFDILALNLNEVIEDFDQTSLSQKKLQFSLLKEAISNSPSSIGKIIREVISLPPERLEELSTLLEDTTLSAIISTSKMIADRLLFLKGLEGIVFDVELKQRLKERSQLHRILAETTWVFGNAYSISVDDESLTEVLRKHRHLIGDETAIDEPVKRIDDTVGIVDLMLSRSIPKNHVNQREHLIVELKAPKVVIGQKEIGQIKSYAFAVAKDERFRSIETRWVFWLVSNDIDDYADMEMQQDVQKEGAIYRIAGSDQFDIAIFIKPWSQILDENKRRYEFVMNRLNISITKDKGLEWLQRQYSEYLEGVLPKAEQR